MIALFHRKFRKMIARIEVTGRSPSRPRKRILEALEFVRERRFPALVLRSI
ncbi:MAG: signal peptide peptidase SppA, partial [Oscillatoriales cyanobacterium SM2_2_1]|nr:signal peptide peptidase SppA [Oscillatoriales cyanobacterium SM2_2_1]